MYSSEAYLEDVFKGKHLEDLLVSNIAHTDVVGFLVSYEKINAPSLSEQVPYEELAKVRLEVAGRIAEIQRSVGALRGVILG